MKTTCLSIDCPERTGGACTAHPMQKFLGKGDLSEYTDEELCELRNTIALEVAEWQKFDEKVYGEQVKRSEKRLMDNAK